MRKFLLALTIGLLVGCEKTIPQAYVVEILRPGETKFVVLEVHSKFGPYLDMDPNEPTEICGCEEEIQIPADAIVTIHLKNRAEKEQP